MVFPAAGWGLRTDAGGHRAWVAPGRDWQVPWRLLPGGSDECGGECGQPGGEAHGPAGTAVLFLETWDAVVLGPNLEEGITTGTGGLLEGVWSPVAPAGWSIDNSAMPQPVAENPSGTDGVREWYGWSFAKPQWWAQTAGDQGRNGFASGIGDPENEAVPSIVAIADPDEWDDLPHAAGRYASSLISPEVDISAALPGTVVIAFDSSWQMEAPQKARIEVSLDNGPYQEIMLWSAEGADTHPDAVNERVFLAVNNDQGSKGLRLRFTLFDAGNNWWWALDNIEVTASRAGSPALPLVMNSVALDPVSHVAAFRWQSNAGRAYTLQYSFDMKSWFPAKSGIIGAQGSESQTSLDLDDLFPGGFLPSSAFFRIRE
jgi:hypothetical protein